ncbi:MAG: flagellar protein FlaG [Pseudomonadota bacterium]
MTILNKLNVVSSNSVTQISPLQQSQDINDGLARHPLADGGNSLPAAQQVASLAEARRRELSNAVKNISSYIQNITRELNFSVDEELGKTVVTVIDESSGSVIRQIPSEDMIELAKNISELKERAGKGILLETDA